MKTIKELESGLIVTESILFYIKALKDVLGLIDRRIENTRDANVLAELNLIKARITG